MKKTLLIASLLLAGGAAANEVTIDISGELAPTSCTLALTNAAVDLGNIPTAELAGGHTVSWDAADAPRVNISCTGDVLVGFSLTDNRDDTLGDLAADTAFGIGRFEANGELGNPIGSMALTIDNVEIEDRQGPVNAPGNLVRFNDGLGNTALADLAGAPLRKSDGNDARYTYESIVDEGARLLAFDLMGTLTLQDSDQIEPGFTEIAHTIDGSFTVTAHF